MLCLYDCAVYPLHAPSALWKYDATKSGSPLLKRDAIRTSECSKLDHCPKEHLPLPTSDCEGRIPVSKGLEAGCSSVRREPSYTLRAKYPPASSLHFSVSQSLLSSKLVGHSLADGLGGVALLQGGRQRKRQLDTIRPVGVVGIEEMLWALDKEPAAPELVRHDGQPRPIFRATHQARFHGIRGDVGELFDNCSLS